MKYDELKSLQENWNGRVCLFGAGLIGSTWGYDLLMTMGFHIDFYCDNKKKKGMVIRDDIKTISLEELYSLGSNVLVFITVTDKYHKNIKCQLRQNEIYNIVETGYLFLQTFIESLHIMNVQKFNEQFRYILDDREYISRQFEYHYGYRPDLNNPRTLSEKLQWIKLYDRKPEYERYVDKYEVKKYVADKIGERYIIPTLGIYDSFDEIDLRKLPQQFVLKCTHDSGSVRICEEIEHFDLDEAKNFLSERLTRNFYWWGREWPYKNVKPRIIVEKYLTDTSGVQVYDYKVLCFEGEPYLIEVIRNRFTDNLTQDFYDVNWNKTEIYQDKMPMSDSLVSRPVNLNEMLALSRKLAQGIHCIRVDWYDIDGQLFFGELTFFDTSGFSAFCPESAERRLGDLIKLPLEIKTEA